MLNTKKQHLKKSKGRSASSTRWLQRQLNDPYVIKAHELGLRGRAYFKLEQIDEKFHIFQEGLRVVDLGCSPGGWLQYAVKKTLSTPETPFVLGLDILPTDFIPGSKTIQMDFTSPEAPEVLFKELNQQKVNIVMSDMAPNTSGITSLDHLKIMGLLEIALDFALKVLDTDGTFIAKVFQGGTEQELLSILKQNFKTVKHFKPNASRKESSEFYVIAQGFQCTKKK